MVEKQQSDQYHNGNDDNEHSWKKVPIDLAEVPNPPPEFHPRNRPLFKEKNNARKPPKSRHQVRYEERTGDHCGGMVSKKPEFFSVGTDCGEP